MYTRAGTASPLNLCPHKMSDLDVTGPGCGPSISQRGLDSDVLDRQLTVALITPRHATAIPTKIFFQRVTTAATKSCAAMGSRWAIALAGPTRTHHRGVDQRQLNLVWIMWYCWMS